MTMRFGKFLILCLLAATTAAAQVTTRPPGPSGAPAFSGGTITTPLLGPIGCVTPPFSFTADTGAGLCIDGANLLTLQIAPIPTASTASVSLNTSAGSLNFLGAGSLVSGFVAVDAEARIRIDGTNRLTVNGTTITSTLPFRAPSGCTNPRFGFTDDTTAGMCLVIADDMQMQSGTGASSSLVRVANSTAQLAFTDATSTLTVFGLSDNLAQLTVDGVTALSSTSTAITPALPILAPAGAFGAPSYSFSGDSNSGFYSYAADSVALTLGGVNRWIFEGSNAGIYPFASDTYGFGYPSLLVREMYVARGFQGGKSTALTDATATAFVRLTLVQTIGSNYEGGEVIYSIYCDDDTNQASQSGTVMFACHDLAGTEACSFGTPNGVTLGDGTASLSSPTFDATSGAADTIDLRVTSDCTGIVPNTHTILWRLDMPTNTTVTPQ
jgi:hypothetical protein